MPILFKPEFMEKILSGEKTVTRRRWKKPRVKVGGIYQARTKRLGEPFARLRVVSLNWEHQPGDSFRRWRDLTAEAHKEGFRSWILFRKIWEIMHGELSWFAPCWRIEFEVVGDALQSDSYCLDCGHSDGIHATRCKQRSVKGK